MLRSRVTTLSAADLGRLASRANAHLRDLTGLADRVTRGIGSRRRTAEFVRRVPVATATGVLTVGDLGYGGYQIPGRLLDEHSVVLAAGAGTDVGFESILVDRYGCRVHLLDPVQDAAAHVVAALAHEPRITFEQAALWRSDTDLEFHEPIVEGFVSHSATDMHDTPVSFVAKARSVGSLRAEHGWERIDLLKISAEGSEFAILDCVLAADEPITVICVEFAQLVTIERVKTAIRALEAADYHAIARSRNWKMTFERGGPR